MSTITGSDRTTKNERSKNAGEPVSRHSAPLIRRRTIVHTGLAVASAAAAATWTRAVEAKGEGAIKPTVVLVHGAFAESSSWDGVVGKLQAAGFPVVAAANPLRGVKADAEYVAGIVDAIKGPVVLVGHSYGGTVITNAANGRNNVKALVFVAAFAPEAGESSGGLAAQFPGGTLGSALAPPVLLSSGGKDLYIQQEKFPAQFAADLPAGQAKLMAASQRPIVDAALDERSGAPAWKTIPSWFIYGTLDKNIPPAGQAFMASRAGARKVIEIKGASHVVMTSHPAETAKLIVEAAMSVAATPSER
jgi:pimeloyl-ACP methyl ester carboxylesterase